jgi:hypothetical protein
MLYGYELPESVRSEFDYVEDIESSDFIKYKGMFFWLGDFSKCQDDEYWHGYYALTVFSAVVIRIINNDKVIVGMILN